MQPVGSMHFKPDYGYDKEAILLKDIELIRKACQYLDMNTREELIRMKEESGIGQNYLRSPQTGMQRSHCRRYMTLRKGS